MSNDNNNYYYYKYLKYKKKYLELLEGGSRNRKHGRRHNHGHGRHHNHFNKQLNSFPLNNMPLLMAPNQALYARPIITSPRIITRPIITSPRIITSPIITSPRIITSPIITSPIILGTQIFSNKIGDDYNEFNLAFDFFNRKFNKDTFIKIINSTYIIGSKNYKGKNIIDIQREKDLLVSYFISENVWTMNIINTFEILMSKLQYKIFYTPNQRIDFQEKIKKYIILDELSHIMI